MSDYIKRPVPATSNSWDLFSSMQERDKKTERFLKDPLSFLTKKQREQAEEDLQRERRRQEEKERRQKFLADLRKQADLIREQKKKKLAEADAIARAEKKKKEEEYRKAKKEQQALEEREYLAELKANYGEVGAGLINNSTLNTLVAKAIWNFNNTFGSLNEDRHSTHMTELVGESALNKNKVLQALAHKTMLEYQRSLNAAKQQKQLLLDQLGAPVENQKQIFSEEYQNYRKLLEQLIAEYDQGIKAILLKMQDKDLMALDEEYKLNFIRDNGGRTSYVLGEAAGAIKEFFTTTGKEREQIKKARRQSKVNEYNDYLTKYAAEHDLLNEDGTVSAENENKIINSYISDKQFEQENIKKEYEETAKNLNESQRYWNVSEAYKKGKQIYQDNSLLDWKYWKYVVPGTVGSSNSSKNQMIGNAIQTGAMVGGAALSVASGVPAAAPAATAGLGQILSIPWQIAGGFDENEAEVGEKKISNLKAIIAKNQFLSANPELWNDIIVDLHKQSVEYWKKQGRDDKWIQENYFSKTDKDYDNVLKDFELGITKCNSPQFETALLDAGKGLDAQFWMDNMRTIGETPAQIAAACTSWAPVRKAGQITKTTLGKGAKAIAVSKAGQAVSNTATKAKDALLNTTAGKKAQSVAGKIKQKMAPTAGKYDNGFNRDVKGLGGRLKSNFNKGEYLAESLGYGYAGKKIAGTAFAAGGEAIRLGAKALPSSVIASTRQFADDIMTKYQKVYDKLLRKEWMRSAFEYGKHATVNGLMISASEGAEEGVQYLNSKEDFASKYGWSSASLGDMIINDITQGDRIRKAYLSLFGIGDSPLSNDVEFWQNVKGGFALGSVGGLHPGQMVNVVGNVTNAIHQYRTNEIIARSAVLDRELDSKDRAANQVFAKLAMQNREAQVANRLQELYNQDRRRENPTYTQEDYDEKAKAANAVMRMTKNEQIRGMLEAKGIKYGTHEYAIAIADLYNLQSQYEQNQSETSNNSNKLAQLYKSNEFVQETNKIVDSIKQDPGFSQILSERKKKAGEIAVKDAIQSAKDAGVDTSTPEFAIELLNVRKLAENDVETNVSDRTRLIVTYKSQLVNRLRALMKFKGQLMNAQNFYDLLKDKLNLKVIRPDSKTILDNTLSQIEDIKNKLKLIDKDIDFGKTDEDLLNSLDALGDVVVTNADEIQQHELNSAVLAADAAVTNSYLNQFGNGVVRTKDGKYQYNPTQYQRERDRSKRALQALLAGNKEEADKINQEDVTTEYDESEVEGNEYKTRIGKIVLANEQNATLDWMAADAYTGDLVNKYMKQLLADEKKKQDQSQLTTDNASTTTTDPITGEQSKPIDTNRSRRDRNMASRRAKHAKNREAYERRKAKAKLIYDRIKRDLRGNAYGSIIPMLPQLAQMTAYLMTQAVTGAYKINEYIQDLKDVITDIDIDTVLPEIKKLYSKQAAKMIALNSDIIGNLSTPQEIMEYMFQDAASDLSIDTFTKIQQALDLDNGKIIRDISTYYHTIVEDGENVIICKNEEAISHMNRGKLDWVNSAKNTLDKAQLSDESFRQAIESIIGKNHPGFPIDTYVKYRSVDGITEAIATHIVNYTPNESVINGIKARNAVLGVLLNEDYLLDGIEGFDGKDEFIEDIKHIKTQLDQAGYKIIKIGETLYDTNRKLSVQADIICIDNDNNIHVVDVLSSYTNIAARYDFKPGGLASYTIREREEQMLHLIEDILTNKFDLAVASLSVLPITCDHNIIYVLKSGNKIQWQGVVTKAQTERTTSEALEKMLNSTKNQVSEINELVRQYNELLKSDKTKRSKLIESQWTDQPSLQQYQDYSNQLQQRKDNIVNLINDLQESIQRSLDNEKIGEIEQAPFDDSEKPQESGDKLSKLVDACDELDVALNNAPDVVAKTEVEKDNLLKLYRSIFDAQSALNEVLLDKELSLTNISEELELIAVAMEQLANNPNLDDKLHFVLNWWCENFVLNTAKSNTEFVVQNEAQQYSAFFNTIKNWVNVLQSHVMEDLDNSPLLQDWYDTLLNVYFSKLLDNASSFAESHTFNDDVLKPALEEKIKEGRDMLADFNGQFSMRPDKTYPDAPKDDAERINRLPQKYVDLYTESTKHSPAYDAMIANDLYYFMSQYDNFAKTAVVTFEIAKRSKRVTAKRNPNLYYDINEGDVMMIVRCKRPDGKYEFAELPLLITDMSRLPNDPETIARVRKINNVNKKFAKIVKQALEVVKNNPNKELSYTVGVHKGRINYTKRPDHRSVTEFVFGDDRNKQDLYTIKLSKDNNLGIAAFTIDEKNETIGYNVYAGEGLRTRIGGFDEIYKKQKLKINNGAIIYFYDNGDGDRIGIPIESESIGFTDAVKIVDLMEKYINGFRNESGYDIHALLALRLYMYDSSKRTYKYNNINNLVTLYPNGTVTIGNTSYNVRTQKHALTEAVSKLRNATDAVLLNENMFTTNNPVLNTARLIFRTSNINEVTLPNGIKLTRDDFVHLNVDGTTGSTWIGYMMRNKLLYTTAIGKAYKQIYIDNFKIVDKADNKIAETQKAVEDVRKQQEKRRRSDIKRYVDMLNDITGKLDYISKHKIDDIGDETLSAHVIEYLHKVIGTDDFVLKANKNQYISQVEDGYVLGYCTSKMIEICTSAPMSVAYHEAFHRVFELLIPSSTRDKIYETYKSKNKNVNTDRDVAEALADHFVLFMNKLEKRSDYKGIKFLHKVYDNIAQYVGLARVLGLRRAYSMMSIYKNLNRGKYANTKVSKENAARFEKLFGEKLHYTVTNNNGKSADFKYINDSGDVRDMVKALGFWMAKSLSLDKLSAKSFNVKNSRQFVEALPSGLINVLCGNNLEESEIDDINLAFREVFQSEQLLIVDKNGKGRGYTTTYPKLDILLDDIKEYVKSSITRFTEKGEEFSTEELDEESEEAMSKNIEKYDKNSFEDSKLDAIPENVKFFFATIPYMIRGNEGMELDLSKNKYGQPTFMPMNEVYNQVVDDLGKCESLQELDTMLQKNSNIPMYKYLYDKFHAIYGKCYTKDENGNDVVNYDAESYCIGILSAIRSQKHDFIIATSKAQDGGKEVSVKSSSLDRDKYTLTKQWYNILTGGLVSIFKRGRDKQNNLVFTDKNSDKRGEDVFSKTADFIQNIVTGLSRADGTIKIGDNEYNLYDASDLSDVKNMFVDRLNNIGIIISRDALDYLLSHEYAADDTNAFGRLFTDKGLYNVQSFIENLNSIVPKDGVISEDAIKQTYTKCGFVNLLASYASKHRRSCVESMSLGLNGKKLHSVSLNNTISFIVSQLNTRDKDNPTIRTLSKYGYNLSVNNGFPQGSIILEHIYNGELLNIDTHTYIGSKSDNRNDQGSEYKDEPAADDYMAKLTILQQGMLTFPTLADKGTWMCLSGIPIPGMLFVETSDESGNVTVSVQNAPTFMFSNGKAFIRPNNQVLDRMIAYANTERLAIQQCMEDLGYKTIPGYKKQGRHVLTENEKIKNLHTSNKVRDKAVEPNGTRFLSLTEIAVLNEDGTIKLKDDGSIETVNLNDPTVSSVEMLKLANKLFFTKRKGETTEEFLERLRSIMAYTLNVQYQIEIQSAKKLKIVAGSEISDYNSQTKESKVLFTSDDESMFNLTSDYLNTKQVNALANEIIKSIPSWNKMPAGRQRSMYMQCCKSLAMAAILSDATTRSIISSNETQRCFTGNPALFKVAYEGHSIKDSTFDIQKRVGGIVSTGEDNVRNLPNMPATYTCAECKDYEISSGSEKLRNMFIESSVRDAWAEIMSDKVKKRLRSDARDVTDMEIHKIFEKAYKSGIDDLMSDKSLSPNDKKALENAERNGKRFAESYESKINVADGQAYITEEMCKNLLRLRGAFNGNVKKAFDILSGKDKYSWRDKADAYDLIYNAVNIVTTKYTAYGFRNHSLNGEDCSDVAVAYYNKYSLAPLFSCLATGRMGDIYEKMHNQKVDMLMMDSAVKVGSQGGVKYNGNSISDSFNVYEQDYQYLRRQLNTDPEESTTSTLGTQMIKLILQGLRLDRSNYIDSATGETLTGQQVLDSIMSSINELAEIGAQEVKSEFGIDDSGNIDNEKLSNFLKKELSSRDANKAIINAVSLNKDGLFNAPIAALSDAKLIESILISHLNKKIIDITTPGNSFVQRSVFAMESASNRDESATLNDGKPLLMINENGDMDIVVSIDYFKRIIPEGLSFNEARQWLYDNKIIGKTGSGVKANIVGYRIPTQAQSSIHAMRVVDVVPAVKDTVILPAEFTKITGSDKLHQCSNQYNIKNRVNCWKLHIKRTISSQAL